jgi:hypothetical protein
MKKLEVVMVCDGYGDFLEHTLPFTKRISDKIIVVTGKEDKYTQTICRLNDVECLPTYIHRYDGGFEKALAINHGLAHLELKGWVMHMDADIVLNNAFRLWFQETNLDKECIYGIDRFNLNYEQWEELKKTDWLDRTRHWSYLITPVSDMNLSVQAKLGSRVAHGAYKGWCPLGFAQLYWGPKKPRYPTKQQSGAEHCDLLHSVFWEPNKRILIPDAFAIHLTTSNKQGINWKGRKSKIFGKPKYKNISIVYGEENII